MKLFDHLVKEKSVTERRIYRRLWMQRGARESTTVMR